MTLRKGQRLCSYIIRKHKCNNEDVHRYLFYMSDKDFDEAMNTEWWTTICTKCNIILMPDDIADIYKLTKEVPKKELIKCVKCINADCEHKSMVILAYNDVLWWTCGWCGKQLKEVDFSGFTVK